MQVCPSRFTQIVLDKPSGTFMAPLGFSFCQTANLVFHRKKNQCYFCLGVSLSLHKAAWEAYRYLDVIFDCCCFITQITFVHFLYYAAATNYKVQQVLLIKCSVSVSSQFLPKKHQMLMQIISPIFISFFTPAYIIWMIMYELYLKPIHNCSLSQALILDCICMCVEVYLNLLLPYMYCKCVSE